MLATLVLSYFEKRASSMAASLDEDTNRLEKLGMFLSAFAPHQGQEMAYGPTADDNGGDQAEAIVLARDSAILDAFAAVSRIARASFPPPTPPAAPKAPAAKVPAKVPAVGWAKDHKSSRVRE
jgi:hypothetical protein